MGVPPPRRPEDNMASTWRSDTSQWGIPHYLFNLVYVHPTDARPIPKFAKNDKIPTVSAFTTHKWVLFHALWPLVVHQLYFWANGNKNPHPAVVFLFYTIVFKINAISEFHTMRNMAHKYGFLDGEKHERDQVPDATVDKVFYSLIFTASIRPLMSLFFAYKSTDSPLSMTPWVVLETGLYGIVLDFYYYWYHRLMHETDTLWKYHRTHHLTKHPNPLLTLFADSEQELFDAAIIPFMTYGTLKLMGLPMNFFDWWMCHQYIVFTELFGHSGLRIYAHPPSTLGWFLEIFNAQLVIEDHDMHHRKGWKSSSNYGKQTRLWDRTFGTCGPRFEVLKENQDPNYTAIIPVIPWRV